SWRQRSCWRKGKSPRTNASSYSIPVRGLNIWIATTPIKRGKIFLALPGESLLAIPPPPIYAGKTAAESGRTRTAIVALRDDAATRARATSYRAIGRFDGDRAARRCEWKTERPRRSGLAAKRRALGDDFQARLEIAGILQASHDRILRDDAGAKLRHARHIATHGRSDECNQERGRA